MKFRDIKGRVIQLLADAGVTATTGKYGQRSDTMPFTWLYIEPAKPTKQAETSYIFQRTAAIIVWCGDEDYIGAYEKAELAQNALVHKLPVIETDNIELIEATDHSNIFEFEIIIRYE